MRLPAFIVLPLAATLYAALAPSALAQGKYPSRPIRVMLPFAAGSVSDVTLRILADKLGARLGTSVVIDNQPRAGGTTAAVAVKTSPPDGYSLVTFSSSTAISVSLLKSLPYDPGVLNVGTTTVGSTNNLAAHLLKSMTGLNFVIVPFRTPGELLTAVLRNDVDVIIQSYGALKSAIESNQIRALGSTTPKRAAYAPTVPTVDEAGVPGFDVVTWNGAFAPAGTPPEVIDTLNRELRAVLSDPELKQRYTGLGLEPLPSTPAELSSRLQGEIEKWSRVIRDAGIERQ
jgi:tripartite-type tricarboxylate transporter receptor subunit TctC